MGANVLHKSLGKCICTVDTHIEHQEWFSLRAESGNRAGKRYGALSGENARCAERKFRTRVSPEINRPDVGRFFYFPAPHAYFKGVAGGCDKQRAR